MLSGQSIVVLPNAEDYCITFYATRSFLTPFHHDRLRYHTLGFSLIRVDPLHDCFLVSYLYSIVTFSENLLLLIPPIATLLYELLDDDDAFSPVAHLDTMLHNLLDSDVARNLDFAALNDLFDRLAQSKL